MKVKWNALFLLKKIKICVGILASSSARAFYSLYLLGAIASCNAISEIRTYIAFLLVLTPRIISRPRAMGPSKHFLWKQLVKVTQNYCFRTKDIYFQNYEAHWTKNSQQQKIIIIIIMS